MIREPYYNGFFLLWFQKFKISLSNGWARTSGGVLELIVIFICQHAHKQESKHQKLLAISGIKPRSNPGSFTIVVLSYDMRLYIITAAFRTTDVALKVHLLERVKLRLMTQVYFGLSLLSQHAFAIMPLSKELSFWSKRKITWVGS